MKRGNKIKSTVYDLDNRVELMLTSFLDLYFELDLISISISRSFSSSILLQFKT